MSTEVIKERLVRGVKERGSISHTLILALNISSFDSLTQKMSKNLTILRNTTKSPKEEDSTGTFTNINNLRASHLTSPQSTLKSHKANIFRIKNSKAFTPRPSQETIISMKNPLCEKFNKSATMNSDRSSSQLPRSPAVKPGSIEPLFSFDSHPNTNPNQKIRPSNLSKMFTYQNSRHTYFDYGCLANINSNCSRESIRLLDCVLGMWKSLAQAFGDSFDDEKVHIEPSERYWPDTARLTVVLDLDETLVHCCNFDAQEMQVHYEVLLEYTGATGRRICAKMNFRPYLKTFLELASAKYDLVVYTASDKEYAEAVVNYIDPSRKFIKAIFHRRHCRVTKKGLRVKDLEYIFGNNIHRAVLVDNSAHCFAPQIQHGIPILSFAYEKFDTELISLLGFLNILDQENRPSLFLKDYFKLSKFTTFNRGSELLNYLVDNGALNCKSATNL